MKKILLFITVISFVITTYATPSPLDNPFTDYNPEVTLTKSAVDVFCRADDTITYEITVINTGDVPLTNVIITDNQIDGAIDVIDLIETAAVADNDLDIDNFVTITVTHTLNAVDRLYGVVINSASVNAYAALSDSYVDDISNDVNNSTDDIVGDEPTVVYQDFDCDGLIDIDDVDDDNDGILDTVENNGIDPTSDADGDGISQYLDLDDNDATVGADPDGLPNLDTDGDNIPNHLDIDSDGDGMPDNVETQSTIDYIMPTGIVTVDGLDTAYVSTNGITPQNTDSEGVPDYLDEDSDNDNVPDSIEGHDYNHDGIANNAPTGTDEDNDGLDDGYEGVETNDPYDVNDEIYLPLVDLPDTDLDAAEGGDGDVDYRDADDDNDGIPTSEEDNNNDGDYANDDSDGNGIPDYLQAQNVIIPDANFKTYLLGNSDINTNGDTEIQISEAQSYTGSLQVDNLNIADLTGIEAFTSPYLNSLNCNSNQLTSLDLSTNDNLTHLYCENNQLTSLDLNANTNLILLKCGNNPNLTNLYLKNGNNSNFDVYGYVSSDFENLPNLQNVCVDALNTDLTDFITAETGHAVNFSTDCSTLSVGDNQIVDFSVYPTPTEDILNINSKTEIVKVEIYSNLGQLIKESTKNNIDVSNLSQGLYFVKVKDINGNFGVQKIVIK